MTGFVWNKSKIKSCWLNLILIALTHIILRKWSNSISEHVWRHSFPLPATTDWFSVPESVSVSEAGDDSGLTPPPLTAHSVCRKDQPNCTRCRWFGQGLPITYYLLPILDVKLRYLYLYFEEIFLNFNSLVVLSQSDLNFHLDLAGPATRHPAGCLEPHNRLWLQVSHGSETLLLPPCSFSAPSRPFLEIWFLSAGGGGGVIGLELTICGLSGNKLDDEIEKFIRF